jgi:anti-anti-sigma factor
MSTMTTTCTGTLVAHLPTGLSCHGEVDIAVADQLVDDCREQLDDLALPAGSVFVVDLSGVTFMDSAGLEALLEVQELVEEYDLVCRVSRSSPAVQRIVELAERSEQLAWLDVPSSPGPVSPV